MNGIRGFLLNTVLEFLKENFGYIILIGIVGIFAWKIYQKDRRIDRLSNELYTTIKEDSLTISSYIKEVDSLEGRVDFYSDLSIHWKDKFFEKSDVKVDTIIIDSIEYYTVPIDTGDMCVDIEGYTRTDGFYTLNITHKPISVDFTIARKDDKFAVTQVRVDKPCVVFDELNATMSPEYLDRKVIDNFKFGFGISTMICDSLYKNFGMDRTINALGLSMGIRGYSFEYILNVEQIFSTDRKYNFGIMKWF